LQVTSELFYLIANETLRNATTPTANATLFESEESDELAEVEAPDANPLMQRGLQPLHNPIRGVQVRCT
jgi:hypothetical protein